MPVVSGPSVRLSLVRDATEELVVDQDGSRNTAEATGRRGDSQVHDDSEGSDDDDLIGVEVDTSDPEEIDDIILDVLDALADADADADAGADADAVSDELYVDDRITEDTDNVDQADQVVPDE